MSAAVGSEIIKCAKCGAANRIDPARAASAVCGRCHSPLSGQTPTIVTDANFANEVEASDLPVLVDFWAAWCGPCRMVAPILEQLAVELAGRCRVCKLDVDANPMTSNRFRVQSIPSMLIFKKGREVDRLVGAQTKHAILAQLNRHL